MNFYFVFTIFILVQVSWGQNANVSTTISPNTSTSTISTTFSSTTVTQKVTQEITTPKEQEQAETTPKPIPIKLGPIVTTKSGQVRPLILNSRNGREYFAFRGVPFANPPIHFQRFKVSL